jgi:UDPglucose--hexose-1-phosphate uridylyltransferase
MSELRWHPLLEQWVVVTAHRQDRPQMPADSCPFCPGSGRVPDNYDVYLYPNDFPAFSFDYPEAPGACDVVLYSPEHNLLPSQLPVSQWEKVVGLWTRRSAELAADPRVKHVMVFENTGVAVGVTMPHPHGQIYAFPFVPPRVEREMRSPMHYGKILEDELHDGRRIVAENANFVAFAPYFARFPYETQIYARQQIRTLGQANAADLASIISTMRKKYDGLFGFAMPLMMVVRQFSRLYVEFLPLQRSPTKLKYLAAVESGSWTFLNDVIPEEAAAALRAVAV